MNVRNAEAGELEVLTKIWYEGWRDAHAQIVPAELTAVRTLESFRDRLQAVLRTVRVAGPSGQPSGFHIIKGDELYQLYVAAGARGTGVAAALIGDAEACLAKNGVEVAWLACAIGNERAARFYAKSGWTRAGTVDYSAETPHGPILLNVWRYEKALQPR